MLPPLKDTAHWRETCCGQRCDLQSIISTTSSRVNNVFLSVGRTYTMILEPRVEWLGLLVKSQEIQSQAQLRDAVAVEKWCRRFEAKSSKN